MFPNSHIGYKYGDSGDCNIDINCSPEGDDWQSESTGIAMILVGNTGFCSGCMINNTSQDFTPYFLTAFHCILGKPPERYKFRFGYKSPVCGGGDDYSFFTSYGSTLKNGNPTSDAALLQLDKRPVGSIAYAGWSRSEVAPTSGATIHHPKADVMKIALSNSIIKLAAGVRPAYSLWRVRFNKGIVEGGSSGSPFFNQNHQIIGQVGFTAKYKGISCENPNAYVDFGRFDYSWKPFYKDGFAPFLDPSNTDEMEIDAIISPSISNEDLICEAGTTFELQNVPIGATIVWTNSNHLTNNGTNNGTSYTVQALPNTQGHDGWVEATINGVIVLRDEFWVGKPLISLGGSGGVEQVLQNTREDVFVSYLGDNDQKVTEVTWSYIPVVTDAYGSRFKGRFTTGNDLGYGTVIATAKNACGT